MSLTVTAKPGSLSLAPLLSVCPAVSDSYGKIHSEIRDKSGTVKCLWERRGSLINWFLLKPCINGDILSWALKGEKDFFFFFF